LPRVLQPTGLDHMDPHTNTYPGGFIIALAYGQLFKWARAPQDDPGALVPEPYMAESIESPDATTAIIKLRPGIKFHNIDPVNGRDMTPDDIISSWTRIKDPAIESTRITQQEPVQIPTAVDASTVQFKFDSPYAPFYNYIADVWQSIVAVEAAEKGPDWVKQNIVGTGPYQIEKVDLGVEIVTKAFPIPWWAPWDPNEAAPYFDGVVLPFIPDDIAKQAIAILGGQLDYGTVSQADWETIQSDSRFGSQLITAQDFNYMRINHAIAPMNDERVRRAVSMGYDRQKTVDVAFKGIGAQITGPIPTSRTPWGQAPDDLPYHKYDPEGAKQLLTAAGFPDGLTITNLYPSQDNQHTDYSKNLATQLLDIGVTVEHDSLEYGAYLEKARLAATDPEGAGWNINMHWGNRYNDIAGYLAEYRTDGGRNYGHWGDAETDAQIIASNGMTDVKERVAAVQAINEHIADMAWTPGIVLPVYMNVWNATVANFADGAEWYQGTRAFIDGWFEE